MPNSIDFVRCRICGKHLCVISGRHLSTHGTVRETYMHAYRLSPDQLCSKSFRINHSSRSDYHALNKQEWIAAIKIIYQRHGHAYAGFLQKHYPQLYEQGIWLCGDWDAALRAARFTSENMRLWAYWDGERVINEIQVLRQKSIPLYPAYVLKHYAALFSAALRIFGSWRNALFAAGLAVPDSPHDGRRGVLRALRDSLEHHSENDLSEKLRLHAVYYFGSLQKAKAALKTDRRLRIGWSTTKIIAAIRERQRLGKPLGYAARRDKPALVSAAEAYFGSWGNASMRLALTRMCIFGVSGANEKRPPKEIILRMASYLARQCPRCDGYLGIVLREPGRNVPIRAVNGHCLKCDYRLAWIVINGKRKPRNHSFRTSYAESTQDS